MPPKTDEDYDETNADKKARALAKKAERSSEDFSIKASNGFRGDYRITCFSELYDSILMWSHYGRHHSGFCVKYDFKQLGSDHPLTTFLYPVIYTNTPLDVSEFLRGHVATLWNIYAIITKAEDWKYEKEWRLVLSSYMTPEIKDLLIQASAKAIYLGARTSEEDQRKAMGIAKTKGLAVYKMMMNPSQFRLIAEPVS